MRATWLNNSSVRILLLPFRLCFRAFTLVASSPALEKAAGFRAPAAERKSLVLIVMTFQISSPSTSTPTPLISRPRSSITRNQGADGIFKPLQLLHAADGELLEGGRPGAPLPQPSPPAGIEPESMSQQGFSRRKRAQPSPSAKNPEKNLAARTRRQILSPGMKTTQEQFSRNRGASKSNSLSIQYPFNRENQPLRTPCIRL